MDASPKNVYSRALAEAKTELAKLAAVFEKISRRKAQLEAFVANTEPLVPEASPALKVNRVFPSKPAAKEPAQPIWKSIVLAINGKRNSFSVNDALDALERIGRPVKSPNRVQIVRNTLIKTPRVFERLSPGLYAVKKSVQEKEAPSEEKTS